MIQDVVTTPCRIYLVHTSLPVTDRRSLCDGCRPVRLRVHFTPPHWARFNRAHGRMQIQSPDHPQPIIRRGPPKSHPDAEIHVILPAPTRRSPRSPHPLINSLAMSTDSDDSGFSISGSVAEIYPTTTTTQHMNLGAILIGCIIQAMYVCIAITGPARADACICRFYGNMFSLAWRYYTAGRGGDPLWFRVSVRIINAASFIHTLRWVTIISDRTCVVGALLAHRHRMAGADGHCRFICTFSVAVSVHGLWFFVVEFLFQKCTEAPW